MSPAQHPRRRAGRRRPGGCSGDPQLQRRDERRGAGGRARRDLVGGPGPGSQRDDHPRAALRAARWQGRTQPQNTGSGGGAGIENVPRSPWGRSLLGNADQGSDAAVGSTLMRALTPLRRLTGARCRAGPHQREPAREGRRQGLRPPPRRGQSRR